MNNQEDTIAKLHIRYQRGHDEPTERDVSVTDFDPHTISGHCHLREQYRRFRVFDIRHCFNADTGEVIDKSELASHLYALYKKTSRYSLDNLMKTDRPILDILMYVARADGQVRKAERSVITAACRVFTHDLRITESQAERAMNCASSLTLHSFKIAVGRINKLNDAVIKRKLMAACKTIVGTQKTISPGEQEALDYMAKRFSVAE